MNRLLKTVAPVALTLLASNAFGAEPPAMADIGGAATDGGTCCTASGGCDAGPLTTGVW